MGITERKAREKELRRNEIIDAAERVFFSKGRMNATMDDVAAEAELSKGTLYLYFKNKDELFLAIHLRGMAVLHKLFTDAVESQETGINKMHAIGQAYSNFFKDYPDYFNALMYYKSQEAEYTPQDDFANECHNAGLDSLDIVAEVIKIGIQDGTISKELDPDKTATVLWGLSTGILQLISTQSTHLKNKHNIDEKEIMEYAFQFIYRALKSE